MGIAWIAARILGVQVAVTAASALAWWGFVDSRAGMAALAGGACIVLPGAVFAVRAMARGPGSRPEEMLRALYSGAAVRLFMVAGLLFILVSVFTDALAPLLTTLVAALAVQWIALLWKDGHGGR